MEHPLHTLLPGAVIGLALLGLTACTMTRAPLGDPELPYPPAQPPRVGEVLHIPTGLGVTEAQMLAAGTDARIVYVGETHDNPAAHRVQLAVLQAMAERWPGQVSLGMEMLTRAEQPVLDRWVAGELSEKEFLKAADWYTVWSLDFAYYRDLLHFAREQKIPVVGLNAEKALVRAVSQRDPAELDPAERDRLPEMDMTDPYQTAMVEAVFGGHSGGTNQLAGFQRVQTLWDETMAESVVRHLQSFPHDTQRMVVLAGSHHIRYGFGIPRRAFRRLPASYVLIGSEEIEFPEHRTHQRMRVQMPVFPMPAYDYVVFTAYEDLPGDRVKLGVRMEEQDGRVVVLDVVPGSTAEKAGVRKDDVLLALDGEAIADNFDLVYAVGQKVRGDKGVLEVERGGERLTFDLDFQPLPPVEGHK